MDELIEKIFGTAHTSAVERFFRIILFCFWVPLVCGTVGYQHAGLPLKEALYAAFALYFVNPVEPEGLSLNGWVWAARFGGFAVASGIVLSVALALVFGRINAWLLSFFNDFTVIYTDNEWGGKLAAATKHSWAVKGAPEDARVVAAKCSIILYSDDMKALNFFSRNRERFRNAKVYIGLADVDSFLLRKEPDEAEVALHYFNVLDLMARAYWREHHLYDKLVTAGPPAPLHIALIGYGAVGKAVFKYGYLNNLYSLGQEIHYHIWGCAPVEKRFLEELNRKGEWLLDHIHVHDGDWRETDGGVWNEMHRIIIALEDPLEAIQELLYINPQCAIHCYGGEDTVFENILQSDRIMTFGVNAILEGDNIKEEKMYRMAKLINFDYWLNYVEEGQRFNQGNARQQELTQAEEDRMEKLWDGDTGFNRGSNIAAADHYWIKKRLKQDGNIAAIIRELEHLRWCRYHFYNHWQYHQERNNLLRRHYDLLPYHQLPPRTQDKDEQSPRFKRLLDDILNAENSATQGGSR